MACALRGFIVNREVAPTARREGRKLGASPANKTGQRYAPLHRDPRRLEGEGLKCLGERQREKEEGFGGDAPGQGRGEEGA